MVYVNIKADDKEDLEKLWKILRSLARPIGKRGRHTERHYGLLLLNRLWTRGSLDIQEVIQSLGKSIAASLIEDMRNNNLIDIKENRLVPVVKGIRILTSVSPTKEIYITRKQQLHALVRKWRNFRRVAMQGKWPTTKKIIARFDRHWSSTLKIKVKRNP